MAELKKKKVQITLVLSRSSVPGSLSHGARRQLAAEAKSPPGGLAFGTNWRSSDKVLAVNAAIPRDLRGLD